MPTSIPSPTPTMTPIPEGTPTPNSTPTPASTSAPTPTPDIPPGVGLSSSGSYYDNATGLYSYTGAEISNGEAKTLANFRIEFSFAVWNAATIHYETVKTETVSFGNLPAKSITPVGTITVQLPSGLGTTSDIWVTTKFLGN